MVNRKLRIELLKSEAPKGPLDEGRDEDPDQDPEGSPRPLLQTVSHRSIRPYIYRVPRDQAKDQAEPQPQSQRRSTDGPPTGSRTQ